MKLHHRVSSIQIVYNLARGNLRIKSKIQEAGLVEYTHHTPPQLIIVIPGCKVVKASFPISPAVNPIQKISLLAESNNSKVFNQICTRQIIKMS
jgi:hypothetical protein